MSCDIRQIPEIWGWIRIVKEGEYATCKDQKLLVDRVVLPAFEEEDIHVDMDQLAKYMHLCETYIPFELFPWQKFVIALHDCTYKADGTPRWPDLFCMLGRGAGKDGTIAVESFCLTSPYNGIREAGAGPDGIFRSPEEPAQDKKVLRMDQGKDHLHKDRLDH